MTGPRRIQRLNELFRRELSRLVRGGLKDPRVSDVVVTGVRTSGDLSWATVYVRSEPPTPVEEAIEGLEHASGFIRRELGRTLHLRKVPEFRFEADETLERAERIERLLEEARGEGEGPHEEAPRAGEQPPGEGGEPPDSGRPGG